MTRKDFELIAATIKTRLEAIFKNPYSGDDESLAIRDLARDFAREFSATNPRFDAGRFLEACGL